MTLKEFKNVLLTVTSKVYHFKSTKESEYVVWREVGQVSLRSDDTIVEKGNRIAVDVFTKNEYSNLCDEIIRALAEQQDIFVDDPTIIYEAETGLIHYALTCEVV